MTTGMTRIVVTLLPWPRAWASIDDEWVLPLTLIYRGCRATIETPADPPEFGVSPTITPMAGGPASRTAEVLEDLGLSEDDICEAIADALAEQGWP